jgi:hypothetical protein
VRPERFELPTCCSGGNRSIQLSYGRVASVYIARVNPSIGASLPAISAAAATAAATSAAAPSAVTATVAAATTAALGFRPGLIDVEGASAHVRSIESSDGFLALFCVGHLHKTEAA